MRGKPKFKETAAYCSTSITEEETSERERLNIMYDKRVFRGNTHAIQSLKGNQQNLSAAEKDDIRIREEREAKKVDMIRTKLNNFKRQKAKTSPYELSPGPLARIEVDLTYFLTEQGTTVPEETEVKTQTDEFMERPPTPKYVPKKTGIDKIT